jgi:hypothetical protein
MKAAIIPTLAALGLAAGLGAASAQPASDPNQVGTGTPQQPSATTPSQPNSNANTMSGATDPAPINPAGGSTSETQVQPAAPASQPTPQTPR